MIRVLIVEDSPTARLLLQAILESDPGIRVIGIAVNGEDGVQKARALRPNLITMDIRMPIMDGFEATQTIMAECPTPIVVVSTSVESSDLMITFNAIRAGALDVVEKPSGLGHPEFESIRERLLTAVRLMAEVKVIRHRSRKLATGGLPGAATMRAQGSPAVVALGASTGGPAALQALLKALPGDFPLPIVVVQHMTAGFTEGLVKWLQMSTPLVLKIARDNQRIGPGEVVFAPDHHHLLLLRREVLGLSQAPPVSQVRPSATVLFESIARTYGPDTIAVLLTGMGDDGAAGLKAIHDRGGLTVVQDEASSVVFGMPKAAIDLGAADQVLPLGQIAPTLVAAARARSTS